MELETYNSVWPDASFNEALANLNIARQGLFGLIVTVDGGKCSVTLRETVLCRSRTETMALPLARIISRGDAIAFVTDMATRLYAGDGPNPADESTKFLTLAKQLREMGAVEVNAFGISAKFTATKPAPATVDLSKLAAQVLGKTRPAEAEHVRDPLDAELPEPELTPIEKQRAYQKRVLEQLNNA